MGIVERRMKGVRRQRGGVVLVQLDQRLHEIGGARVADGVLVGLELALAGVEARQRTQEEQELRQHEEEERQRLRVARRIDAEAPVEPVLAYEQAEQEKDREAHG